MMLPDLRDEQDSVTLDHCSVLLERLNNTLGTIYEGDPEEFQQICESIDPIRMREDILSLYTEKAFLRLFSSEFGKGVIVGAFAEKFIFEEEL